MGLCLFNRKLYSNYFINFVQFNGYRKLGSGQTSEKTPVDFQQRSTTKGGGKVSYTLGRLA